MIFRHKILPFNLSYFESRSSIYKIFMTQAQTRSVQSDPTPVDDDALCTVDDQQRNEQRLGRESSVSETAVSCLESPARCLSGEARIERAWAHWNKLDRPKLIVAPMVDNSELPFRMLCRKYGAEAAYTPMLHSRIFSETEKYRNEEFTTCQVYNFVFQCHSENIAVD